MLLQLSDSVFLLTWRITCQCSFHFF